MSAASFLTEREQSGHEHPWPQLPSQALQVQLLATIASGRGASAPAILEYIAGIRVIIATTNIAQTIFRVMTHLQ
ncbi:MAG TPA: hypothetical protein VHA78_02820 [Candidatus Peribacteraceae bacterium]|nr:hypothetical protein [Candidatus Peribacteraceae bacterium]